MRRAAAISAVLLTTACADTAAREDTTKVILTGAVLDSATRLPVALALVGIDATASGAAAEGALAGTDGVFEVTLPLGPKRLLVLVAGHRRALVELDLEGDLRREIEVEPLAASELAPSFTAATFEPSDVAPGAVVHLVATRDPASPAADAVIAVLPDAAWSLALEGAPVSSSYAATFAAPSAAGIYTYYVAGTTAAGDTGAIASASLVVE